MALNIKKAIKDHGLEVRQVAEKMGITLPEDNQFQMFTDQVRVEFSEMTVFSSALPMLSGAMW